MDIRKTFSTDTEKEVKGIWKKMSKTCRVRIARVNNKRYRDYIRDSLDGYPRRNGRLIISDDDMVSVTKDAVSETILLEWEGMTETQDDGSVTAIPYSTEMARELFDRYPEFLDTILSLASDMDSFREDRIEETSGN